jgi:23S rRNA pseudouridine1911/1915/1917 synthase
LIGDPSYGRARQPPRPRTETQARAYAAAADFPRQALHARLLGFQHPTFHKALRFQSPWPEDFRHLVDSLRHLGKADSN